MTGAAARAAAPAPDRPVLAVFDFDGTLTDRHTMWRYLRFVATPRLFWPALVPMSPALAGLAARRTSPAAVRRRLVARHLGGMAAEVEAEHARRFAAGPLRAWIRPAALRRLRWHQARGHRTALVSNAFESYLAPWGRSAGFDDVLGTRLEVAGDRLTGGIAGADCVGPEKVTRLVERVGDLGCYDVYAYGDSDGDRELLAAASNPFYRNWY